MGLYVLPATQPHSNMVVGVTWFLTAICIVLMGMRFYVRVTIQQLSSDDWIMLLAVLIQVAYQILITLYCEKPPPGQDPNVPYDAIMVYGVWAVLPAISVAIVARISAAIFLIRAFGVKTWFKWYLIVLTTVQTAAAVVALVLHFGRTVPIEGLWNPDKLIRVNWDSSLYKYPGIICSTLFALSDLTYVLFPTMIIWRLNMPLGRRVALSGLMGLSLITMVAAILKGLITLGLYALNLPFRPNDGLLWSGIEQTLVIIMGTLPTLIPIIKFDNLFVNYVRSVVRQISNMTNSSRSGNASNNRSRTPANRSSSNKDAAANEAVELHMVNDTQRLTQDYSGREEITIDAISGKGSIGRSDCESGTEYNPSCYGQGDQVSATYSHENILDPKEGL